MGDIRFVLALCGVLFVTISCGDSLSGTYADDGEVTAYEFHNDGRATISVLDARVAAEYSIDGDRVIVSSAQGTVVLRRNGDHLYGPMGLELVRQSTDTTLNIP